MRGVELEVRMNGAEQRMPLSDFEPRVLLEPGFEPWRHHLVYRSEQLPFSRLASAVSKRAVLASDELWNRAELADFDPDVKDMIGQPFRLVSPHGPRGGYIPDLLLLGARGALTVVDGGSTNGKPRSAAELAWGRRVVESLGWTYELWEGLSDPQGYEIVHHLQQYNHPMHPRQQDLIEPILERCARKGGATIAEVEDFCMETAGMTQMWVRPVVPHLLWWGDLKTDLSTMPSLESVVLTDASARRPAPEQWRPGTLLRMGFEQVTVVAVEGDTIDVQMTPSLFHPLGLRRSHDRSELARLATALPQTYQGPIFPVPAPAV